MLIISSELSYDFWHKKQIHEAEEEAFDQVSSLESICGKKLIAFSSEAEAEREWVREIGQDLLRRMKIVKLI